MRAPRHRFSEDVRDATAGIAARMVRDGTISRTPADLDAWIAGDPPMRTRLERGGYGTLFTSADLLPLLEAALVRAGGSPAVVATPTVRSRRRGWILGLAALLVLLAAAAALGLLS